MADALQIVCSRCDAVNRVAAERLASDASRAICGRCKGRLFTGQPVALDTPERFERSVARGALPVLVDFWAPWCGPCLQMAPAFAKAAAALEPRVRLAKTNTEAAASIGARYGIQAIPTMVLFEGGREVARQSGALQAMGIVRFTEAHLGN